MCATEIETQPQARLVLFHGVKPRDAEGDKRSAVFVKLLEWT